MDINKVCGVSKEDLDDFVKEVDELGESLIETRRELERLNEKIQSN